nr:probable leucine-rich repeat receptor-like serine/threonine-protein kinase At3g14840 [Ipomoea batatas]GME13098.1 probable leucine-rich repeat receptor-like serine/threonine-protein kinase At3g14840 [Ipomoea batatas]GME15639.1 probable leucine-rich repeat receptor-like serine/threonine-protein kinase At3g14840 [Ipomoea batatas]
MINDKGEEMKKEMETRKSLFLISISSSSHYFWPPEMSVSNFFVFFLCFSAIFVASASAAGARLATDEVDALRQIAKILGKTDWDFNVDPCSRLPSWVSPNSTKETLNALTCDCSDNTTCHVTSIVLKQQDLGGTLPAELVKLPFLQEM